MDAKDRLLDQLFMGMMGSKGTTLAHNYLQSCASYHPEDLWTVQHHLRQPPYTGVRWFIPPKEGDRVILMPDGSGLYWHKTGLITIMGSDIRHEVVAWQEEHV